MSLKYQYYHTITGDEMLFVGCGEEGMKFRLARLLTGGLELSCLGRTCGSTIRVEAHSWIFFLSLAWMGQLATLHAISSFFPKCPHQDN